MSGAAVLRQATPFESASEFRDAHARLLEALDQELGHDASAEGEAAALARLESRILEFVHRGEATGVFLEEMKERTACQILLDYWASSLSQAGRPAGTVRLARFDGAQLPDLKDKPSPYVGLDAFRDNTFFFGREADTQSLLVQLQKAPLVVVLGASGSGKSSLVIGGVLPALATDTQLAGLCVVPPFVPGNTALTHLALAVRQSPCGVGAGGAADGAAFRQDPGQLSAMVGGAEARPVLITIDQFEEVFTLLEQADREALVANLAQLLKAGRGHRVVLTVREEFRSRIVGLGALSPFLDTAWYSMRPMGYAELRAAVEKPAAAVNLQFQSGIVDDLVKKVLGQPAALPLLQFTLHALWEKRDRNRITFEVYRKVGDPLNALTASADEFYDGLARETQNEVKRILLELVRVDELLEAYRQPVPKSRLLLAGSANTEAVLGLLARNDYVRVTSSAGDADAVVEVKHESLVRNWPRFVSWIDEKRHQRRGRLALTQAAERWAKSGKPRDGLLTGWQLEAAESATELLELEKEFVLASIEAVDRVRHEKEEALRREAAESKATARRFRILWIVTGLFAVIAIYASYSAFEESQAKLTAEALNREKVLLAMKLQPLNYVNDHLDLALLLGIEATRMTQGEPELRRALLSSLIANLELKSLIPGHTDGVRALAFSPNANILASGAYDATIILWDAEQGRMLLPPLKGHTGPIYGIAFRPDGKTLASASADRTVRLWEVKTGRLIGTLLHDDEVYGLAIENNGKILASGGKDGTVRLWNLESRKPEGLPLVHNEAQAGKSHAEFLSVAFSPDGKMVASGGLDGRIVLWDMKERKQAGKALMVNRQVFSMAFSHDGKTIASGNNEGRVDLWDVGARKWLRTPSPGHFSGVYGLAFSPDDTKLATVGTDRTAYIRDVVDMKARPRRLKGFAEKFLSVSFSRDGKTVVTGTSNAMIVLWDLAETHRFGNTVAMPNKAPAAVAFGANGNALISSSRKKLNFWDLGARVTQDLPTTAEAQSEIDFVVTTPDRKFLFAIGQDNSVEMWDVAQRRRVRTLLKPGKDLIRSAAVSVDNQTLAIGVGSKIQLMSLPDGAMKKPLAPGGALDVGALAFSPDAKTLASAQYGVGITIWDVATSQAVAKPSYSVVDPRLSHRYVDSLAFSLDGRILVSGGADGVGFWDSSTGQPDRRSLAYHPGRIASVAVSPDGRLLASASNDKSVLLWDFETLQPLSQPIRAHNDRVRSLAFSPDGKWLASSDEAGAIIRWELDTHTWWSRACEVVGRNFTTAEWRQFFGSEDYRITCPVVAANNAEALSLVGDRAGAERSFLAAVRAVLETGDHRASNSVCWHGSVNRFAKLVLPACDKAVKLAPNNSTRHYYQDSRGLARALTGDTAGAIDDFTTALESMKAYEKLGFHSRENWIAALKEGRDPFDDALLESLRLESAGGGALKE